MVLLYQPSQILISIYQSGNNKNKNQTQNRGVGFTLGFRAKGLELYLQFSEQTGRLKIAFMRKKPYSYKSSFYMTSEPKTLKHLQC